MWTLPARVAACLSMLLLVPAASAPTAGLGQPPYPPGAYEVDSRRTRVHFQVKSLFGGYQGDFLEPTGTVTIDPRRPNRADIDISFPVSSLTTGDASTDQMLKGGSFFDMEHYPAIRFAANDALIGQSDLLTVNGQLTMHGRTRTIAIAARLAGLDPDILSDARPTLRFIGAASVKRSQFGMGFGRPFVANRVDLSIDATFRQL
ncbi:Polyisoprenoid-binding protein YceI [Sphingobium faniae]|nr:Polyisoprenoid-binding protein YceI [Sphingobium faniae]